MNGLVKTYALLCNVEPTVDTYKEDLRFVHLISGKVEQIGAKCLGVMHDQLHMSKARCLQEDSYLGPHQFDYWTRIRKGDVLPEFTGYRKYGINCARRCVVETQEAILKALPEQGGGVWVYYEATDEGKEHFDLIPLHRLTYNECRQVFYTAEGHCHVRTRKEQKRWLQDMKKQKKSRITVDSAPKGDVEILTYAGDPIKEYHGPILVGRREVSTINMKLKAGMVAA